MVDGTNMYDRDAHAYVFITDINSGRVPVKYQKRFSSTERRAVSIYQEMLDALQVCSVYWR